MASARSMRLSRSVFPVAGKTLFSPLPRSVSSTPLSSIIPSTCTSTCSTCCFSSSGCRYGITTTTNSGNACNSTAWVDMGLRRQFHSSTPSQFSAGSSGQINQTEFTDMAWEGIIGAVDAARMNKQQVVESEHLMKALLEQKDGLAQRILAKAGIDSTSVLQATDQFIAQQPKVLGDTSRPVMGSHLKTLLDNARKYQKELGNDFVSLEHFMLTFHSDKRFGQQLLKNLQLGEKELKEAILAVRGNQKVTDQNPEGKFEALEKYGNDLTELAKRGKLDPVIGHDDEIWRCIQILSRRTKNNPVIIG